MARRRFTIDADSGLLVDRDGNALGRVVALTIDDSPVGGLGGRSRASGSTSTADRTEPEQGKGGAGGETRPTASQLQRDAVQRCWDYWIQITGKRQRLDTKRERTIRNALHICGWSNDSDEAERLVKLALLGLTRSPHHNGHNEQHREYLEIRYALRGIGDESDDERIEKAITWAALHAPQTAHVDPAKIDRWLDEVRFYVEKLTTNPQAVTGRDRANEAYKKLRAVGFTVIRLDKPPWARVAR